MSADRLLQKALQNLHTSQQAREGMSMTPRSISQPGTPRSGTASAGGGKRQTGETGIVRSPSLPGTPREANIGSGTDLERTTSSGSDASGEEMVAVGKDTRPGTPAPGTPIPGKGLTLGSKLRREREKVKDPLRSFPTHLAVKVYLQLDIRSLARCSRVCKRWNKSSTLNYVWFLQNRALTLPAINGPGLSGQGKMRRTGDDTPDFFDPYDKSPRLASLPQPPMPTSAQLQWTKAESKRQWKSTFRTTLKRSDPDAEEEIDHRRVTIESLRSSGASTPGGGYGGGGGGGSGHSWAGQGSGGASRWAETGEGTMTPTERKIAAREGYKAMGGRKARGKRRMGGELGVKDKGGVVDDGRFDAPW